MAKYYYNGVLLPEIPADVLAEYPYIMITNRPDNIGIRLEFSTQLTYVYWQETAQELYYKANNGNIGCAYYNSEADQIVQRIKEQIE